MALIERATFVAAARSCIGTRVGYRGRAIGQTLCGIGVPWAAAAACGLEMPHFPDFGMTVDESDILRIMALFADRVSDLDDAHVWQVRWGGAQARHVAVPVGTNGCGQPLVVWATPFPPYRHIVSNSILTTNAIRVLWRIRGIE